MGKSFTYYTNKSLMYIKAEVLLLWFSVISWNKTIIYDNLNTMVLLIDNVYIYILLEFY